MNKIIECYNCKILKIRYAGETINEKEILFPQDFLDGTYKLRNILERWNQKDPYCVQRLFLLLQFQFINYHRIYLLLGDYRSRISTRTFLYRLAKLTQKKKFATKCTPVKPQSSSASQMTIENWYSLKKQETTPKYFRLRSETKKYQI